MLPNWSVRPHNINFTVRSVYADDLAIANPFCSTITQSSWSLSWSLSLSSAGALASTSSAN